MDVLEKSSHSFTLQMHQEPIVQVEKIEISILSCALVTRAVRASSRAQNEKGNVNSDRFLTGRQGFEYQLQAPMKVKSSLT